MKYLLTGQESERLQFRLLTDNDFDVWLEFFDHPDVAGFMGLTDIETPYDRCKLWFGKVKERYNKDLGGLNALIDKKSGQLVGQSGLLVQEVDGVEELEIGYSIMPKYWKLGYATEAAIKCRDFAFENGFAEHLISIIHVDNHRSVRVALKNGMKVFRETEFLGMPVKIFRIEKTDWEKIRS